LTIKKGNNNFEKEGKNVLKRKGEGLLNLGTWPPSIQDLSFTHAPHTNHTGVRLLSLTSHHFVLAYGREGGLRG
jgi:hypothetical protein